MITRNKQQLKDIIEWDVVNWSKAIRFWESKKDLDNKNLLCLELGGRSGGLSLWLALKGNTVICSDLQNPQQDAEKVHLKYSLTGKISYEAIDATNIGYENKFDVIVFKSILGGIGRDGNSHLKKVVVNEIYKALKPGGVLLFAENLQASRLHRFLRKKLVRWGASWDYVNIEDVKDLFGKFDSVEYKAAGFLGAFGKGEAQRNLFGKLDSFVFDNIVTSRMKYIVFGVASKK